MKGLVLTLIVIILLIVVGIGVSMLVTGSVNDEMATAGTLGFKEGYTRGYEEGFEQGGKAGYQEGSKTGYLRVRGEYRDGDEEDGSYFAYNPTYAEVQEILVLGIADTAEGILEHADSNGIRGAYVRVKLADEADAAISPLVAFETVDRGFIVIEPWSYRKVKVEVGRSYSELNDMPAISQDDTITKISIIW